MSIVAYVEAVAFKTNRFKALQHLGVCNFATLVARGVASEGAVFEHVVYMRLIVLLGLCILKRGRR